MQATIQSSDMARLYLETLEFLPPGHMGDEIALYAHYVACGWNKDAVQTLNTLSRAINKYYSVLLCYCGTSA